MIDRAQQDRRRHRVVDDERNAVTRGNRRQRRDVADIARRIADAFAEHGARVLINQLLDRLGGIGVGETHLDPLARQNMGEQRVRGAVELQQGNDVAAHRSEVEYGVVQRRLPGTHAQGLDAAFERSDAALEHGGRRVADAAVAVTVGFEIEQGGAVIGAVEFVGDGLIDRDRDRPGCRFGLVTAVYGHRVALHTFPPRSQALAEISPLPVSYPSQQKQTTQATRMRRNNLNCFP
jgi:hypothetical protein